MIVLDAGGTLIGADWNRVTRDLAASARKHGLVVRPAAIREAFKLTWQDVISGEIPDRADSPLAVASFWHQLLARALALADCTPAGDPYPPAAWETAYAFYPQFDQGEYHRLIDGAPTTLSALASAGYRLGLLSNWSPALPQVLQRLNIDHFFEFAVVSSLVGLAKPDPAIFDLAARKAGLRPDRLLYVGDSPASDIAGSRAAGWDAVLVARRDPHRHGAIDIPMMIDRLIDLLELLGVS